MERYVDRPIQLKPQMAGVLEIQAEPSTTPASVANGLADLSYLRRPSTPQGIETLCEIVVRIQERYRLDSRSRQPVYVIGGTMETGWPIDPAERLNDCIIAAADLGMFDPVPSLTPEQDAHGPFFRVSVNHGGPPNAVERLQWPAIEPLPNGDESEFSPLGGQWIATRRYAYTRLHQTLASPDLSTHAHFLWDLDFFISAIVDLLFDKLHEHGVLNTSHPG